MVKKRYAHRSQEKGVTSRDTAANTGMNTTPLPRALPLVIWPSTA